MNLIMHNMVFMVTRAWETIETVLVATPLPPPPKKGGEGGSNGVVFSPFFFFYIVYARVLKLCVIASIEVYLVLPVFFLLFYLYVGNAKKKTDPLLFEKI